MQVSEAFEIGRAINHGIEALKRQPLGLILGAFLLSMTQGGSPNFNTSGSDESLQNLPDEVKALGVGLVLVMAVVGLFCAGVLWLARTWLTVGYLRMQRDIVVDGQAEVTELFRGSDGFGQMLLWSLLSGVIGLGTLAAAAAPGALLGGLHFILKPEHSFFLIGGGLLVMLLALPATIYVGLGLAFGSYAVALDGLSATQALERSWKLARGNRVHLFIFMLVTGLFASLGLLLCCIGVVVTRPIRDVGVTEGYLLATRDDGHSFALMQAMP